MKPRKSKFVDNPTICPKCGGGGLDAYSYSDTVDFRNLELDVEGLERYQCRSCGLRWETPTQLERNQVKIKNEYANARDRLRQRYGLLTADQIERVRKDLSLTQKEAAGLFGGGSNAFNKYESGEVLQSYAMDRLIRLTDAIGAPAVEFLRNVNVQGSVRVLGAKSSQGYMVYTMHPAMGAHAYENFTVTPALLPNSVPMVRLDGTFTPLDGFVIDMGKQKGKHTAFQANYLGYAHESA